MRKGLVINPLNGSVNIEIFAFGGKTIIKPGSGRCGALGEELQQSFQGKIKSILKYQSREYENVKSRVYKPLVLGHPYIIIIKK